MVAVLVMLALKVAAQDVSFDNDTLRVYVEAYIEVREVEARYADRLRESYRPSEEQALEREREAAVEQAIRDAGLTPETFRRVGEASKNDRELRGRIARLIVEIRSDR